MVKVNNVIRHLEENPQISEEVERIVREQLLTTNNAPIVEDKDEQEPEFLDA